MSCIRKIKYNTNKFNIINTSGIKYDFYLFMCMYRKLFYSSI